VASNAPTHQHPYQQFSQEYARIRGVPYARASRRPFYLGTLPNEALGVARLSAQHGLELWQKAVANGEA
jgi:hypothetical protein